MLENSKRTLELDTKNVYTLIDTLEKMIMASITVQQGLEMSGKKIPKKLSRDTRKLILAHADLVIANKAYEVDELESILALDSFEK